MASLEKSCVKSNTRFLTTLSLHTKAPSTTIHKAKQSLMYKLPQILLEISSGLSLFLIEFFCHNTFTFTFIQKQTACNSMKLKLQVCLNRIIADFRLF